MSVKSNAGNRELCPLITLLEYITTTKPLCANTKLFIFFVVPHRLASVDSIATTIRDSYKSLCPETMPRATAHEIRAIASSMFVGKTNIVNNILALGLWTNKWFYLGHYQRDIQTDWDLSQFALLVVIDKVLDL